VQEVDKFSVWGGEYLLEGRIGGKVLKGGER